MAWAAWPDLARPTSVGDGPADAALIIGVEDYFAAPRVPGARRNARDWYTWFIEGRGVPAQRVRLLLDAEATAEEIRGQAQRLAAEVGPEGSLWIVFIGHGAPDPTTGDASLLGVDVQPTAQSLAARGLSRRDLLGAAAAAPQRVFVLDSCFSGQTPSGESLAPGLQFLVPSWAGAERATVELTAGTSAQVAGTLPRENRPAFSYLLLGALHGWGDLDGDGVVTADEALTWTRQTLDTVLVGRDQTPQRFGEDRALARAGRSRPPNLAAIVGERAAAARRDLTVPVRPTLPSGRPSGIGVDVKAEQLYEEAMDATESAVVTPSETAAAWCRLAQHGASAYLDIAEAACAEWTAFASDQNALWVSFAEDYDAASQLLALSRVPVDQKLAALDNLTALYGPASAWHAERIARTRSRVASRGDGQLPTFWQPPEWSFKQEPRKGLFAGWDPAVLQHPWVGWNVGAGASTVLGFTEAQLGGELGLGPLILGGQWGIGSLSSSTLGGYVHAVPFVHRPSGRLTGERRGSWLNPSGGLGLRYGNLTGENKTWFDLEAANTIWIVPAIGVRVEGRLPIVGNTELGPTIYGSVIIDTGRRFAR